MDIYRIFIGWEGYGRKFKGYLKDGKYMEGSVKDI